MGLAHLKRENLGAAGEEREADQLRLAVAESMCRSPEKRKRFDAAVTAVSFEMPIETYCKRILKPAFWGGEPELLVLAEILRRRIVVYIPAAKAKSTASNSGTSPSRRTAPNTPRPRRVRRERPCGSCTTARTTTIYSLSPNRVPEEMQEMGSEMKRWGRR